MSSNVLYIEDNQDNMHLVKLALEIRGYKLLPAVTGLDGINRAEKEDVDLILLDLELADLNGYEVARRIRSSSVKKQLADTPIIAITANALEGDAQKALAAGCNLYLSKPISIHELWSRVETFVSSPIGSKAESKSW